MLTVRLYNFTKKTNSTKLPSGGTAFQCLLNTPSGVVNPSLTISGITSPTYNYCYVPDFGRYYWIREWSWNLGDWIASCEVDVLASYKSPIGASTQYVLRSESDYDLTVVDTHYPALADVFIATREGSGALSSSGTYVLGIINGQESDKQGAVTYYAMSQARLGKLLKYMLTESSYTGSIDKTQFNPTQYIVSAMWFPFALSAFTGASVAQLWFGWWSYGWQDGDNALRLSDMTLGGSQTFGVVKHPKASTRGSYFNLEPWSQYEISWRPFGVVPIDTTVLLNYSIINAVFHVDVMTGGGIWDISVGSGATDFYHIKQVSSQIGVPVQLAQISRDALAQTSAVIGAVAGGVSSLLTGNALGVISSVASGISSAVQASKPQLEQTGRNGSRALFESSSESGYIDTIPRLQCKFMMPAEENIETWGRPLCSRRKISDLSGFIMCAEVELSIGGTSEESDQIKTFMEGGFHYE